MSKVRIFLTNLRKYNEGELIGEWLSLPATDEELAACKARIGINERHEEWFITDYETDLDDYKIGEYDELNELNEIAALIDELNNEDMEKINALVYHGYTVNEAIERLDDCIVHSNCQTMTDVAYEVVEESGLLNQIPESLQSYFDYEAFGRDLGIEGQFYFTESGDCIEIAA